MYFYNDIIDEPEDTRAKTYYINNDIILTNYEMLRRTCKVAEKDGVTIQLTKPSGGVRDKYNNVKHEANKLNYNNANLKDIFHI
jgi:hypothetical protein